MKVGFLCRRKLFDNTTLQRVRLGRASREAESLSWTRTEVRQAGFLLSNWA